MMGGIRAGLISISTSPITINTLSVILKGKVAGLLRPTSTSCTIAPTILPFKFRYTQQSTMVTQVMGGRVAGMGPISASTITTNCFSRIARGKLYGILIPISTPTIINSYIPPRLSIIMTSISTSVIIIITGPTLLFLMILLLYTTRINLQSQKSTTVTWFMGGIVSSNISKLLFHYCDRNSVFSLLT